MNYKKRINETNFMRRMMGLQPINENSPKSINESVALAPMRKRISEVLPSYDNWAANSDEDTIYIKRGDELMSTIKTII